MNFQTFDLNIQEYIATVSFNRTEKANSLDMDAWLEMKSIFEMLDSNQDVRVIILEGHGKHWCSGIDISLLLNFQQFGSSPDRAERHQRIESFILKLQSCINSISENSKPVIAAIHGACIGGGLDIASACDIRYCTDDAFFSIKEIDFAMVADLGSLQRLPHILIPGVLEELAYTGRKVAGREAARINLVNQSFAERQEMKDYVNKIAERIATHAPQAIQGTKQVLRFSRNHSIADGLKYIARYNGEHLSPENMMEAYRARKENRKPDYQ